MQSRNDYPWRTTGATKARDSMSPLMNRMRKMHKPHRTRNKSLAVVALALTAMLTACSSGQEGDASGDAPTAAAAVTQEPLESSGGDESAVANSDSEVDKDCLAAFAVTGLIEAGLRLRAEQGPLTEQGVADLFGDTEPYVDQLPDDTKADYQTYHDAALSAVGLEDIEVDAILDASEVQDAIKGATNSLDTMSACY